MIPMGRPLLPPAELLLPYLQKIDANRWYCNAGPLVREYEERMGQLLNCYIAATSSGTAGLTAVLLAQELGDEELFLPAWTFVATANAVKAAGLSVAFTDVDEETWTPKDTDIAVAPFGAPVKYEGLIAMDAAAAFDAVSLGQIKITADPIVVSTHATKTFSTGEGGLVLSKDKALIGNVKEAINHGLTEDRKVPQYGINGKMSEYHAAVGLAEMDNWAWKRARWLDLKRRYVKAFGDLAHTTPLSSLSWVGSTFCIRVPDGDAVRKALLDKEIMSRKVWGDGVHKYQFYAKDCFHSGLSVTDKLAKEVVFLPYSIDQTDDEIEIMASTVREIMG